MSAVWNRGKESTGVGGNSIISFQISVCCRYYAIPYHKHLQMGWCERMEVTSKRFVMAGRGGKRRRKVAEATSFLA